MNQRLGGAWQSGFWRGACANLLAWHSVALASPRLSLRETCWFRRPHLQATLACGVPTWPLPSPGNQAPPGACEPFVGRDVRCPPVLLALPPSIHTPPLGPSLPLAFAHSLPLHSCALHMKPQERPRDTTRTLACTLHATRSERWLLQHHKLMPRCVRVCALFGP
jgi:hypothetical protein